MEHHAYQLPIYCGSVTTNALINKMAKRILVCFCGTCLVACGGDSTSTTGIDEPVSGLNGLYDGAIIEQAADAELVGRGLIYEGELYLRRDDRATLARIEYSDRDTLDMDLVGYLYSQQDEDNSDYIAAIDPNLRQYPATGLIANETEIIYDYVLPNGNFGTVTLTNDASYESPLTTELATGKWTTTDASLVINNAGAFVGSNNANGCNFEGQVTDELPDVNLLMATMTRNNCPDLNQSLDGFMTLNNEGALELYFYTSAALVFTTYTADGGAAAEEPAAE